MNESGTPVDAERPVRITIDLDPDLHRRLKVVAAEQGLTLSDIVRGLVENWVDRKEVA